MKHNAVKRAVIMAAGFGSRMIPITLTTPKPLVKVKGKRIIDTLLDSLVSIGIKDITIVRGYKKESFNELLDKYPFIKFIDNDEYNVTNNISSLYKARHLLNEDMYICEADLLISNPKIITNKHTSTNFLGTPVKKTDDWCFNLNPYICNYQKGGVNCHQYFGISFWTKKDVMQLAKDTTEIYKYNKNIFWEFIPFVERKENYKVSVKLCKKSDIVEIDSFEELCQKDSSYISNNISKIKRKKLLDNISTIFNCDIEEIKGFIQVKGGLTNNSYLFSINNESYIYRDPGKGTDKIINRANEKHSLEIAKKYNIDPTYVYMDINEGYKISKYVDAYRFPDYSSIEDSKRVIKTLKKLHSIKTKTNYYFRPFEDSLSYERKLNKGNKERIKSLKNKVVKLHNNSPISPYKECFIHADTYKPNWLFLDKDNKQYLIDWEYAGMGDKAVDIAYYIVDAGYDIDKAKEFIKLYDHNPKHLQHYLSYVIFVAYYWYVWALEREQNGKKLPKEKKLWKSMVVKYLQQINNNTDNI